MGKVRIAPGAVIALLLAVGAWIACDSGTRGSPASPQPGAGGLTPVTHQGAGSGANASSAEAWLALAEQKLREASVGGMSEKQVAEMRAWAQRIASDPHADSEFDLLKVAMAYFDRGADQARKAGVSEERIEQERTRLRARVQEVADRLKLEGLAR